MEDTINNEILDIKILNVIAKYPYADSFFNSAGIKSFDKNLTMKQLVSEFSDENLDDLGIGRDQILENFISFIDNMEKTKEDESSIVNSVTIIGGYNKLREREDLSITLNRGEIISIVGPTGSGKSRLLEDIECLAQNDTPTGRQILVNGKVPEEDKRFSIENKLIAQLSQNMNFIMDVTTSEFITRHAESRRVKNIDEIVKSIIKCANDLAGEKFSADVPVTQLSGGQSRALMIADTALLSKSPIVLIDEIENAGVDRKKAIEFLVKREKIVLMSTHDPILALMGNKRIVIKNGGINKIINTSKVEKNNLEMLSKFDYKMLQMRNLLRNGKQIDFNIKDYFKVD
ncbi:ABC-type antimicrobial peptide transport system, ATPase component [Clostridium pasteurianum DSM 525 = ATCC 6013]|uniref:ABC transporter related protein n=1 Tax=Clostridium pasteurianum DSM 525 = ATCC 6013 TaxID=1262449 RepID=A0A0H3JBM4_CLOPA|nr:ATP-binding cassette domain-containing protein [Clostridium pasteurianum]AJA49985.1 ABC-type antimicrobial peptide transport system, ATPase component [Clostridium pasteurianum DSM 525 = ATCC 6013]AJA53973.1 ABC-type antimicrobial peptide transport system, ATPase component [Clostridium pasteurianum DSM 525 = ATCC 6013]AOZ77118.1 ABC transporter [Clostridium pasteurianum DSM 525 = ATCC 6013]AOZ80915.1 ABC transporter [Clostridium pasteurianum]ELP59303.1 ABC transporter ATPase [Clostridium pas